MSNLINALLTKDKLTENGAVTHSTSSNYCLDLFFLAGACRNETEQTIQRKIAQAYTQDRVTALKIIFWAGDIRQGAGERRFFKIALQWLLKNHKQDLIQYINYIPLLSRWDVLFELNDPFVLDYICSKLTYTEQNKPDALLCKWLPRKNQYKGLANKIQKKMRLTPKQYRKFIVEHTKVVEQQMFAKQWSEIEYSHIPSVAINKYNKAWYRNDKERFEKYIEDVKNNKNKINASVIYPHNILAKAKVYYGKYEFNDALVAQWNNLPNYMQESNTSILPVCDVSGSMYGTPLQISLGLGLYLSERNKGQFKDAFITFSERPELQYLKGSIQERVDQLAHSDWGMNTNIQSVFSLILNKAIDHKLTQEDLPNTVLIISDMEFDDCGEDTNLEAIKYQYSTYGYKTPNLVFWNVNGRADNVPIKQHETGTCLISGASPHIIKAVLTNNIDPIGIMNNVITNERYSFID